MSNENPDRFFGELLLRVLHAEELVAQKSTRQLFEVFTEEPFGFFSAKFGYLVVPHGLLTDFGSVPSLTKALVDDDDPFLLLGSVVHDALYVYKGRLPARADLPPLTRQECDQILFDAMVVAGAPWWKRQAVYWAVRAGGAAYWNRH